MNVSSKELLALLKPLLTDLRADLAERASSPRVSAALRHAHEHMKKDQRTADPFDVWVGDRASQIAAAWVLSLVFVRTLEDKGLLDRRRIAGDGAEDSQDQFMAIAPFLNARDYLLTVFEELARLPGAQHVFDAKHNPVWVLGPSGPMAQRLIDFLRERDAQGDLRITFGGTDTRFLGDLYQDLDEDIRARYALLQTPDFVESFILDETLDPAIETFGLAETKLIDPTCGSGHFLLGAFDRLFARHAEAEPGTAATQLAERALAQVAGADLNPYAVAIARFRLTLAFLDKAAYARLADAPAITVNVCVADSLLAGIGQRDLADLADTATRAGWGGDLFLLEDPAEAERILGARFHAVVGNPPYITEKDRARREKYRALYDSAARKFSLAAPFTERFFRLASDRGYVGMINANSFMKREFGKKLIEDVLPRYDITNVVDTSGAFIPGHGTPTVIFFGRNQTCGTGGVLAVLGIRGEPTTPPEPTNGHVWSSIRDHYRDVGFENDYITVVELERDRFAKHPWSLGGGGASELKEQLEAATKKRLRDVVESIGVLAVAGEDDAFMAPSHVFDSRNVGDDFQRPLLTGFAVRDWDASPSSSILFPYHSGQLTEWDDLPEAVIRWLWPRRTTLLARALFGGGTYRDAGRTVQEYHQIPLHKLSTPLSITFAEVATHNHFVLDRGGKVFNRTAPIIKLPEGATEEDHLALLGYLNSSTACFYMRQVAHQKQMMGADSIRHTDPTTVTFAFNAASVGAIPIPTMSVETKQMLAAFSRAIESEVHNRRTSLEKAKSNPSDEERAQDDFVASYRRMVALQEELDWYVYGTFGLLESRELAGDLSRSKELIPGRRPFEIRFRHVTGAENTVDGFAIPPMVELDPSQQARFDALDSSRNLRLMEQSQFKRRWIGKQGRFNHGREDWAGMIANAQSSALLDAAERCVKNASQPVRLRDLVAEAQHEHPRASEIALSQLVADNAVPFLSALRLKPSGLKKRGLWEATWEDQRREDAGESIRPEAPPRYKPTDFVRNEYYRLRGKLDVPKERFISYPGAETDDDPSPLIGWAGWDHLQRATALSGLYVQRKGTNGWLDAHPEKLVPLLAGLLELVPWLKQWHNEPDPSFSGRRLGDFYGEFVESEARKLGKSLDDLRAWRPEKKTRKRSGAKRQRAPKIEPAALIEAIRTLNGGSEGVELAALAAHLGATKQTVSKLASTLVADGTLTQTSARPKSYAVAPS